MKKGLLTTHPAVIAVWAALIAAVMLVPAFPIIGTGATFSVSSALFPLAGIFFGPVAGALCAAIGAFVGHLIAPHTAFFGPLSFLVPTLGAFCAGVVLSNSELSHRAAEESPVSYTHLRAHETHDHIGCRLLLEHKQ